MLLIRPAAEQQQLAVLNGRETQDQEATIHYVDTHEESQRAENVTRKEG